MIDILSRALIPIFLVIGLGYWAGSSGRIDNRQVTSLNVLVMDFALPAAMFGAITQVSRNELLQQWVLVVILAAGLMIIWAAVYSVQRNGFGLSSSASAIVAMSVALPNSAATSIPLMTAVFGHSGQIEAVVGIVIGSIVLSPLSLIVLELNKAKKQGRSVSPAAQVFAAVRRTAVSPLIQAPLIAVIVVSTGLKLPVAVEQSFVLLGAAASPVALLLTGVVLSARRPNWTFKVAAAVAIANIAHPALSWGLARTLPTPTPVTHAAVLLSALPTGFFGILFALRYQEDITESASIVAISTLVSILTLSLAIALTANMVGQ